MPYRLLAERFVVLDLTRRQDNGGGDTGGNGSGGSTDTETSTATRSTTTSATSTTRATSSTTSSARTTSHTEQSTTRTSSTVARSTSSTDARSTSTAANTSTTSAVTSSEISTVSTSSGILFSSNTDTLTSSTGIPIPTSFVEIVASTNSDGTVYTVTNVVSSSGTGLSNSDSGGSSFMSNKPAVIGVFLTVAFATTTLLLVGAIWIRRRMKESRREKDTDFAITAVGSSRRPPTPDNNDQPEGDNEKSTSSHGTLNQVPMVAASAVSNSNPNYGATTTDNYRDPYSNAGRNDYAYGNGYGNASSGYNDGYANQAAYSNGYGNQGGYNYDNYGASASNAAGGYYNDGYGNSNNHYGQDPYGGTTGGYSQDPYAAASSTRHGGYDDYGGQGQSGYGDRGGYDNRGYNDYSGVQNAGGYYNDQTTTRNRGAGGGREADYGDPVDDYYGQRTGPLRIANE